MSNIPKKLLNESIKSQTSIDRYSHHLNRQIQTLLKTLEAEICARVAFYDPSAPMMTEWRLARLNALNQQISRILKETYGQIEKKMEAGLSAAATAQADHVVDSFNRTIGVDLFQVVLTPEAIKGIVENTMIDGRVMKEWWEKQADDLKARVAASMKAGAMRVQIGTLAGESIGELIGRIRGNKNWTPIMDLTRKQATTIVRTSVMQVCGAIREETYKANSDVLSGFEFVATLDSRTSLQCRALDGKRFDLDMNPVGHSMPFPGIPAHWNCRSTIVPITKSWAELAGPKSPLSRDQIRQLEDSIPKGQRASMNGPVPAQTYDEWLRDQPEAIQMEILGPRRWEMWKENKLNMADLVDNAGRPLTLGELKRRLK